jgi:sn-1,2-diacylglycerol ethanolamine- and cholinephosphotranferases
MAVLTDSQLKRLREHKYCSEGRSIAEFIFQPFWNYVVTLMPLWLAPNLITILGLIVNVSTSALILLYSPKADTDDVSI